MSEQLEKWSPYLIGSFSFALCCNLIVFFRLYLFLFHSEINKNMTLVNLILCSTISSAVFNSMSICYFFFDDLYSFLKIETIFKTMLRFVINEDLDIVLLIKKLNCLIGFSLISMFFLIQNLYAIESIKLLKNPMSNFSLRGKIYKALIIFCLIISFIVSYFLIQTSRGEIFDNILMWIIHPLAFFFGIYVVVQVLSIRIMINILKKKSIISSFSHVKFAMRHFFLMIITIGGESYLFYLVFDSKPTNIAVALLLLNAIGVIYSLIQLFEIEFSCNCNCDSRKAIYESTDELNGLEGLTDSSNLNVPLIGLLSPETKISLTEELHSHYLIECFDYILEGIVWISGNQRSKSNTITIVKTNHYSEQIVHSFHIVNHKLIHIDSSVPHQSKWSLLESLNIFSSTIRMIEYSPDIFNNIRQMDGIDSFKLQNSFNLLLNKSNLLSLRGSEGKSGSLFLMTHDYNFLIKTISEKELNALINNFIKNYYNLLAESRNSLLSKIYGAFTLKMSGSVMHLLILENIAPYSPQSLLYKFDFKGSRQGRKTKKLLQNTQKTLKDLDYLDLDNDETAKISLNSYSKAIIRDTIREDIKMLQESNLMDYSLFIAVAKNNNTLRTSSISKDNEELGKRFISQNKKFVYYIGIIDYLTEYDYMKNFEAILLKITHFTLRNTFSAVNSLLYRLRFFNFVSSILFN